MGGQLDRPCDLWFNDGVDIVPIVTNPRGKLTEMRDWFDYDFLIPCGSEGEVAAEYSGTQQRSYGTTGVAATYVVDTSGVIQYEHVGTGLTDRTYDNWVRYSIRNRFEDPFWDRPVDTAIPDGPDTTNTGW